jgi:hypothetical protein
MSPEQSEGLAVDPRTDLYAMGILLYKLLTGRVPFVGKSAIAVIQQQVREAVPPPRTANAALAPAWDDVLRRALAKEPSARYPDAVAFDAAIEAAWQEQQRAGESASTTWLPAPSLLYEGALRALMQGNWPRTIALCGEILEAEPAHTEARHLLAQAYKALHQHGAGGPVAVGSEARPPAPPAVLAIRREGLPARAYVVVAQGATLGRSLDSDVVLADAAVSRQHCRIAWDGSRYYVEDLGSSNGTRVNSQRVQRAPLHHGDLIQVGDQMLEFIQPS